MKVVKHLVSFTTIILLLICIGFTVCAAISFKDAYNTKVGASGIIDAILGSLFFFITSFLAGIFSVITVIPTSLNFVRYRTKGLGFLLVLNILLLTASIALIVLFFVL